MKRLWNRYLDTYAGLPRAAWLLASVQLVNTSGTMVIFFMTLYLSRQLGIPMTKAGLAMSGYGVGMLAGTLTGGALADRLGAFTVQRLSLFSTGLLLVALAFFHTFPWICAGTVLWGFCSSALFPANSAAMAAICPVEIRAKGFVLIRLANNLGATVGPVVGGFLARHDYRMLFWVDGGTCLLAALALLWIFPGSRPESVNGHTEDGTGSWPAWWKDGIFLTFLLTTLGTSLIFSQLFSTYGPYLKAVHGFTEPRIGSLIAVNTILIVAFQMPLTHGMERYSRVLGSALGCLLLALGFGSMPWVHGMTLLACTVALWTFGEMLAFPGLTTLVSLRAPQRAQGRYQGLYSLSFSVGFTVGPFLGASFYFAHGGTALWSATAVLALVATALLLGVSRRWDGREAQPGVH